jgi:hypothetical protein
MPPEVTCPACQHRFPAACGPVCPHCGAALARTEVRPASGDIQVTPRAPAALPTTVCPACGKEVVELCLICPYCEAPLAERHRVAAPKDDGWKGRAPYRVWLVPLAIVGAIAVLLTLPLPVVAMIGGGAEGVKGGAVFLLLLFLLLLAFAVPILPHVDFRSGGGWERVLVGGLANIGCLVLMTVAVVLFVGSFSAAVFVLEAGKPR